MSGYGGNRTNHLIFCDFFIAGFLSFSTFCFFLNYCFLTFR